MERNTDPLKNLLAVCRYYDGSENLPQDQTQLFWYCEKIWVESALSGRAFDLSDTITVYLGYGLREFENLDGTPLLLKAILFNRNAHWHSSDPEEFKNLYREYASRPTAGQLQSLAAYFNGESSCPFEYGTKEHFFWHSEQEFIKQTKQDPGFYSGWIQQAQDYIRKNQGKQNTLTDPKLPVGCKALILYIDAMLEKWVPEHNSWVFEYLPKKHSLTMTVEQPEPGVFVHIVMDGNEVIDTRKSQAIFRAAICAYRPGHSKPLRPIYGQTVAELEPEIQQLKQIGYDVEIVWLLEDQNRD